MNKSRKKNENRTSNTSTEKEIPRVTTSNTQNFLQLTNSKENIELSLEVEIADSLKKLLSQPENCNSRLLDVTIIRPSDEENNVNRIETNTVAFGKDEIKDLVAIIEQQRKDKEKTLKDNIKKRLQNKHVYRPKSPNSVQSDTNKSGRISKETKRMEKHGTKRRDIGAKSAPPNINSSNNQNTFKKLHNHPCCKVPYGHLRNVETRLLEICHPELDTTSYDPTDSEQNYIYNPRRTVNIGDGHNTQIYTTANTFDSLCQNLSCQHKNRRESDKSDVPCLCQHCGMMGLLIESQKGPILPQNNLSPWTPSRSESKAPYTNRNRKALEIKNRHNTDCVLHKLHKRLTSLEDRVASQEENAVSKEYFKKIMGKLLTCCKKTTENSIHPKTEIKKDNSVQCSMKDTINVRHKDVKVQSDLKPKRTHNYLTGQNYCINSALLQNSHLDRNSETHNYSHPQNFRGRKNQKIQDGEPREMGSDNRKEETDRFWKWGEEIIKPGFDLKNKIISLLDDALQNLIPQSKSNPSTKANTKHEFYSDDDDDEEETKRKPRNYARYSNFARASSKSPEKHRKNSSEKIDPSHARNVNKAIDDTVFRKNILNEKQRLKHSKDKPKRAFQESDSSCAKFTSYPSSRTELRPTKHDSKRYVLGGFQEEILKIPPFIDEAYQKPIYKKHDDQLKALIERQKGESRRTHFAVKPVKVAYVSPKVNVWKEDSSTSIAKVRVKNNLLGTKSAVHNKKNKVEERDSLQGKTFLITLIFHHSVYI